MHAKRIILLSQVIMWKIRKNNRKIAFDAEKVLNAARVSMDSVYTYFHTTSLGLTDEEVGNRQSVYGTMRLCTRQENIL